MQVNFNVNERHVWIGAIIVALVVGFFGGKYYAESHHNTSQGQGWKFDWKLDGKPNKEVPQ